MRIMASCPISPRASSPTTAPSRSTTTRSAHCSTSFRRCEMKITATPPALSSAITFRSRAVSEAVRLEVGSSMMTMRASSDSALTISTSWRWASDRSATGVSASKSRRAAAAAASPSASIAARSISFNGPPKTGSRPIMTLAATSRLSKRLSSWCTKAMPAAMAPATVSARMLDAVDADRAFARLDDAAQDLHQGRFAGAVLADQRQHLAALDPKARRDRAPSRRDKSC